MFYKFYIKSKKVYQKFIIAHVYLFNVTKLLNLLKICKILGNIQGFGYNRVKENVLSEN